MPRDLSAIAEGNVLQEMPTLATAGELSASNRPETNEAKYTSMLDEHSGPKSGSESGSGFNDLHPYTQTLTLSDIDSCVSLENAAFPPHERATPEKFQYRLKHCGELCMGIFTSQDASTLPTADSSAPVASDTPGRKSVLIGHIVSTKTTNSIVTDSDMAIPTPQNTDPYLGHKESGRTLCIHSVAILPEYHGRGLGTTLLKAYLQRMKAQNVADRVALIAHDHLVPFYERVGFTNSGKSAAQFGGGGWFDMVQDISPPPT